MLGQRGCSDVQVQAMTQIIVFYTLVEKAHDTYISVTDSDKLGDGMMQQMNCQKLNKEQK